MADFVKANYGSAGKEWIRALAQEEARDKLRDVRGMYDYIFKMLNTEKVYTDKPMGSLAVLLLADWLVSVWLFGEENAAAELQMWELSGHIKAMLPTKKELDQTERAWEHIQNWIIQNKNMFVFSGDMKLWGRAISDDEIFITTLAFSAAFEGTQFTPSTAAKGFRERGYLNPMGTKGMIVKCRMNGGAPSGYRLWIKTTWYSESCRGNYQGGYSPDA